MPTHVYVVLNGEFYITRKTRAGLLSKSGHNRLKSQACTPVLFNNEIEGPINFEHREQ